MESGQIITESTTIDFEEFEPCYHWVHQPIDINHSDNVVEQITSCRDEFEWHGMTFYRSEQTQYASVSLTNIYDCDSVVELQLDFGDYAKITETPQRVCDSYYWPRNHTTYLYDESQPHVMDSVFIPGDEVVCDSMIYLDLTMGRVWEMDGEPMMECSGFIWHGIPYYEDAVIYDSLQTVGTYCDSIIAYQLTIIPPIEKDTSIVSCQPMFWNGHYFWEEGDEYTHTYTSQYGCDSIVTAHFSLADEILYNVDTVACEFFNWYGYYFAETGQTFSHTFQTPSGCDSTVVMHATIVNTEVYTQLLTVCDSVELGGVWYTEPGNYYVYGDTLYSQSGCDSIVYRVNLTVNNAEQMGLISGLSNVYVASNLITGIYRYEINPDEVEGSIVWHLSNPDWQIVEAVDNYCRVFVGTPGSATLTAAFTLPECGEAERDFIIHAGFFDVGEQAFEVNVYPNPTKGTVTIEAEDIESIRLINMMGQVLEDRQGIRSNSAILNLSGYAPSVYLVEIHTAYGTVKKRVTVCR